MPESEMSKKITKLVKRADKFVRAAIKGVAELREIMRDLKEKDEDKE